MERFEGFGSSYSVTRMTFLPELHYIVCNQNTVYGRWGSRTNQLKFGFLWLSVSSNKDSAAVWLSDRLGDLHEKGIYCVTTK